MSYAWILTIIFGFILIKHAMDTRAKQDGEKMRVLEEALKRGNLDDETRERVVEGLTGRRTNSPPRARSQSAPPPPRSQPGQVEVGVWMKIVAFFGWVTLCLGIAFMIAWGCSYAYQGLVLPAAILTCVGFGLVTYPFVIRELQTVPRRQVREPS